MSERWVLQFCHSHYGPFMDVARQYAVLFAGTPFKVLTVFLTGDDTPAVRAGAASDEVLFLGQGSRDVRGLKLGAIRALRNIMASRKVELIIAHRFKPIYIACLASKLPVIGVHHGFGDYKRWPRRWFARLFRRRLSLLGVSDAVRDDIRTCLPDWPDARIETLYNRIDLAAVQGTHLDRPAARAALQLPGDAFIVGNVGRLHPDKDQATLVRGFALALPTLPANALLALMGTGPLEHALKMLAAREGVADRVVFLGNVNDGRRYFKAFDVFALSSDHEPFGMVLLEAMAAQIPVICSDCGGGKEVVKDAGLLFPMAHPQALATAITELAGQTETQRQKTTLAALQKVRTLFSDTAAREKFFSLQPVIDSLRFQPEGQH